MISVADRMARNVVTMTETDPLAKAAELVLRMQIRHLPVVSEAGLLVGIVTDRDIKRALPSTVLGHDAESHQAAFEKIPVSKIMSSELITVHPEQPVSEAVRLLAEHRIGAVPVVEEGFLVGIFTETDALKLCLELLQES